MPCCKRQEVIAVAVPLRIGQKRRLRMFLSQLSNSTQPPGLQTDLPWQERQSSAFSRGVSDHLAQHKLHFFRGYFLPFQLERRAQTRASGFEYTDTFCTLSDPLFYERLLVPAHIPLSLLSLVTSKDAKCKAPPAERGDFRGDNLHPSPRAPSIARVWILTAVGNTASPTT